MKSLAEYGFKPDESVGSIGQYVKEDGPFKFHFTANFIERHLTCVVWQRTEPIALTCELLAKTDLNEIMEKMKQSIRESLK